MLGAAALGPAAAAASGSVRVTLGAPEVVIDYGRDSCPEAGGWDLPDVPARAFRTPLGDPDGEQCEKGHRRQGPRYRAETHSAVVIESHVSSPFTRSFATESLFVTPHGTVAAGQGRFRRERVRLFFPWQDMVAIPG